MAKHLNKDPYTYHKERDSFVKDLKRFHACRGTPVNRMPTVGGKPVDLFLLYTKVTALGGWEKVNDGLQWEDLLPLFNLPVACTNAGHALKLLYLRYLEVYERVNFKGELTIRPQYEDDMDDQASGRKRRARPTDAIPATYKYQQHNLTDGQREQLHLPSIMKDPKIFHKLEQSLMCGLPNEVDFVMNVVTLLSSEGRHTLQLQQCPRLLERLLAQVAIYKSGSNLIDLHDQWRAYSGRNFLRFWYETVEDRETRNLISSEGIILQNGVFVEGHMLESADSENIDQEVFNLGQELGTRGAEGQRVLQLATIVRNLSFEEKNMEELASNILVFRFMMLCIHNTWGNLKQMALDTLSNVAPKMVLDPITNRTTQLILRTISRCISSPDKFEIVSGLDILSGLCQVEANEDLLSDHLEEPAVYNSIITLLTIHDIQLIVHALETLYQLSELGENPSNHIARVHSAVETLVGMVTVEAQSYGPNSLMGIKVVELMTASSTYTPVSEHTQTPVVQHTPVVQPASVVQQTPVQAALQTPIRHAIVAPPTPQVVPTPAVNPQPQPAVTRVSIATTQPSTTVATPVYRPPTPHTPTPAPTPVASLPAQELDTEILFLYWLHSTYEHRVASSQQIPRVALFQEYSIQCNKHTVRNVVHMDKIPNLVRLAFPSVDQRFIQLEGGKSDVVYTGLRKKQSGSPFPPATPADAVKYLSAQGISLPLQKVPQTCLSKAMSDNKPLMTPPASPAQNDSTQPAASTQFPSIQQALLGTGLTKPANHMINITTSSTLKEPEKIKVLVNKQQAAMHQSQAPTTVVMAPPSSNVVYTCSSAPVSVQYVMATSSHPMVPVTTQSAVIVQQWPQQTAQQQTQYQYSVVPNPQTYPTATLVHQPQVVIPAPQVPTQEDQATKPTSKKKSGGTSPKSPKPKSPVQAKSPKPKKSPSSPKAPKSPKADGKSKSPKSKKSKAGSNKYVDMLDDGLGGEEEEVANVSGQSDLLQQAMMESDLFADEDDTAAMDTDLYSSETMLSGQVMDQVAMSADSLTTDIPLDVNNGDEAAAAALALSQDPLVASSDASTQPAVPPLELPQDITGADALFNGLSLPSTPCSVASSIDSKESESSQPKDILKAAVTKALGRRIHMKEDADLSHANIDIKSQLSTFNGAVKHIGNGDCHTEAESKESSRPNGGLDVEESKSTKTPESELVSKTLCQAAGDSMEVDTVQRDVEMPSQQNAELPLENGYSVESPGDELKEKDSPAICASTSGPLQVDGCADEPDSDDERSGDNVTSSSDNTQSESLSSSVSHLQTANHGELPGLPVSAAAAAAAGDVSCQSVSQYSPCDLNVPVTSTSASQNTNSESQLVTQISVTAPSVSNTALTTTSEVLPVIAPSDSGVSACEKTDEIQTQPESVAGQQNVLVSRVSVSGSVAQLPVATTLNTSSSATSNPPVSAVHVLLHRPTGQHSLSNSHTLSQPAAASYHEPHPIPSLGSGILTASSKPMTVTQNVVNTSQQLSLPSVVTTAPPLTTSSSTVQFMPVTQTLTQQNPIPPKFIQVPPQPAVQMSQQVMTSSQSVGQAIVQQPVLAPQQFVQTSGGIVTAQQIVQNPQGVQSVAQGQALVQVTQPMAQGQQIVQVPQAAPNSQIAQTMSQGQQIVQVTQAIAPGQQIVPVSQPLTQGQVVQAPHVTQAVAQAQVVMQPQQELTQQPFQVDVSQQIVQQQVPVQMVHAQQVPGVQVTQQIPAQIGNPQIAARMPVTPAQSVAQNLPQAVQFQKVQLPPPPVQNIAISSSQPQQILPKPAASATVGSTQVVQPAAAMMAAPQQQMRVRFVTVTPQGQQQVMHISIPPGMSLQTFLQQQQQKLQQQGIQPAAVSTVTSGQQIVIAASSGVSSQVPVVAGVTATSSSLRPPVPQPAVIPAQSSQNTTQPLSCSTTQENTPQSSPLPSPGGTQKPGSKQQVKRTRSISPGSAVKPSKSSKKKKGEEAVTTPAPAAAAALPDGPLKFLCEWKGCKRMFDSVKAISKHVTGDHFPCGMGPFLCDWEGCDKLPRQRWSFMTHLQDRHLNMQILRASAIQRQQGSNAPIQQPPAPPPVYPKDAAIQAIRRFSVRPPYQELMENKEGPVTKHIRLTSALILRNLARYSALGRSKIKRYEQHLAYVALSSVESSSAIAHCLMELQKH